MEPLGSHSIVESIYRTLRQEIATGNLPPGARLHQAELAEQLGTSRTPVREALAHLASDRLVEFQPNRGYFVATMSESRTRAAVDFGYATTVIHDACATRDVEIMWLTSEVGAMRSTAASPSPSRATTSARPRRRSTSS